MLAHTQERDKVVESESGIYLQTLSQTQVTLGEYRPLRTFGGSLANIANESTKLKNIISAFLDSKRKSM